ncbi:MAG: hypothetical protein ACYTG1_12805 [Planctomycetota bacterium]|jgi:hypothetical protein
MKRITTWMVAAIATASTALASMALVSMAPAPTDPPDHATLARQVEVMRLVLANSINREYAALVSERRPETDAGETRPLDGPLATDPTSLAIRELLDTGAASAQFTSHTRGFYADGLGVIFTTEVDTPVVGTTGHETPDAAAPDEWDEAVAALEDESGDLARSLVTLGLPAGETGERVCWRIDPEFVETAIDSVLTMLGKHGHRLEALPADEYLVVGLRLTPGWSQTYMRVEGSPLKAARAVFDLAASATRHGPEVVHVVIRLDMAALPEGGRVHVDVLRELAVITRY